MWSNLSQGGLVEGPSLLLPLLEWDWCAAPLPQPVGVERFPGVRLASATHSVYNAWKLSEWLGSCNMINEKTTLAKHVGQIAKFTCFNTILGPDQWKINLQNWQGDYCMYTRMVGSK